MLSQNHKHHLRKSSHPFHQKFCCGENIILLLQSASFATMAKRRRRLSRQSGGGDSSSESDSGDASSVDGLRRRRKMKRVARHYGKSTATTAAADEEEEEEEYGFSDSSSGVSSAEGSGSDASYSVDEARRARARFARARASAEKVAKQRADSSHKKKRFDDDDDVSTKAKTPSGCAIRDEITQGPLEKMHLCWSSPDGSSKMCFNLTTLLKIGLANNNGLEARSRAARRAETVFTSFPFMQPPHFRSRMSEELIQQLRDKFTPKELVTAITKLIGKTDHPDLQDSFSDEYAAYQGRTMSVLGDLHVCCICWSRMEEKAISDEREDRGDDSGSEKSNVDPDPMEILLRSSQKAPLCTFLSKNDAVSHIRSIHRINAPTIGLDPNFFSQYTMRAPDGLLQRWISRTGAVERPQQYWQTYAPDYIKLHSDVMDAQIAHAALPPSASAQEEENIFKRITRPFRLSGDSEDEAFIADTEEEEEEEDDGSDSAAIASRAFAHDWEDDANEIQVTVQALNARYENGEDAQGADDDKPPRRYSYSDSDSAITID